MTGTWPGGEKAYVQQSTDLDDQEGNKRKRDPVDELTEKYETSNWMSAGFKKKGEHVYDEIRLRSCVERLREFTEKHKEADAASGWIVNNGSIMLKALEIAIVLKEQGNSHAGEGLPDVDEIMGWIAKRFDAKQMITYLTQSTKAWGLLKDGALAKAIGVKDEKVRELGGRVLETFKTRYEKGVQRGEIWNKPIKEVLQIISHNTLNNQAAKQFWQETYGVEEEEEGGEGKPRATILKDPLSHDDIAALEERLNISLPNDYKEFLAATNGMSASWGGIIEDAPLFPASEIRWITKDEASFTDLTAEFLPEVFTLIRDIWDNGQWPKVGTPLQIGSEDIDEVWLIPPPKVKELVSMYLKQRERSPELKASIETGIKAWAGSIEEFENLEWCVITWASGGAIDMTAYPSFKAFLVNKAQASAEVDHSQECFSYSCR